MEEIKVQLNLALFVKDYLRESLLKSVVIGEPIEVDETTRGIGKSTALAEFAKEFGLTLIVPTPFHANRLKAKTNYENIISQYEISEQPIKTRFVYDEGVDRQRLRDIKVVTGFYKY